MLRRQYGCEDVKIDYACTDRKESVEHSTVWLKSHEAYLLSVSNLLNSSAIHLAR